MDNQTFYTVEFSLVSGGLIPDGIINRVSTDICEALSRAGLVLYIGEDNRLLHWRIHPIDRLLPGIEEQEDVDTDIE